MVWLEYFKDTQHIDIHHWSSLMAWWRCVYTQKTWWGENCDGSKKGLLRWQEACAFPKMNLISYTCECLIGPHLAIGEKSCLEWQLRQISVWGPAASCVGWDGDETTANGHWLKWCAVSQRRQLACHSLKPEILLSESPLCTSVSFKYSNCLNILIRCCNIFHKQREITAWCCDLTEINQ